MAPPRRFILRRDDTIHPVPRHPEELVIGRSRSCGVVVNDSAKISGKHVSVSAVDESVVGGSIREWVLGGRGGGGQLLRVAGLVRS